MTPQDRSLLLGGAAFVVALVLVYLGLAALVVPDAPGQFVGNEPGRVNPIADPASPVASPPARPISTASTSVPTTVPTTSSAPADEPATGGGDDGDPSSQSQPPEAAPAPGVPQLDAPGASTTNSSTNDSPTSGSPTAGSRAPGAAAPPGTEAAPTKPPAELDRSDPESAPVSADVEPGPAALDAASPLPTDRPPSRVPPPDSPDAPSDPPADETVVGLDDVERELLRLTNELRADPSGRLARRKPMPDCVDDPFYAISVDGTTGHPTPVSPLVHAEAVSRRMSRPWAEEMEERNTLQHRPSGSQVEIYEQLDVELAATGENVAWFSGFSDDEAARIHFEGWRESDTGHYCALVSGVYTHVGVGHYRGSQRSWAVQNFYRER